MNPDYVDKALRDFYPNSTLITHARTEEIAKGYAKRGLGWQAFDEDLEKYRARSQWHHRPPCFRDLMVYRNDVVPHRVEQMSDEERERRWAATKAMARAWLDKQGGSKKEAE